jgi:hypothetical protein
VKTSAAMSEERPRGARGVRTRVKDVQGRRKQCTIHSSVLDKVRAMSHPDVIIGAMVRSADGLGHCFRLVFDTKK